jgi:hypothetical protein
MSVTNRQEFYKWYNEQQDKVFDFQEDFLDYCISDVDILRRCCAHFRFTRRNLRKVTLTVL